jgi:plasmid stability protein
MATLYVRNVPTHVYEALQARAAKTGRSLNAEAVAILDDATQKERDYEEVMRKIEQLARKIDLAPEAPTAQELIRRDRDSGH